MKTLLLLVIVGLGMGCRMKENCFKCVEQCTFIEFYDEKTLCLGSVEGILSVKLLIPPGNHVMCGSGKARESYLSEKMKEEVKKKKEEKEARESHFAAKEEGKKEVEPEEETQEEYEVTTEPSTTRKPEVIDSRHEVVEKDGGEAEESAWWWWWIVLLSFVVLGVIVTFAWLVYNTLNPKYTPHIDDTYDHLP